MEVSMEVPQKIKNKLGAVTWEAEMGKIMV
jgi:hypothetical protein